MRKQKERLSAEDLPVLEIVLGLHPDLEMVLFVGIHARRLGLKYPLKSHKDLAKLFPGEKKQLMFRGHSVTYDQAVQFLSKEFFPIANEEEFLRRILISLQRETLSQVRKVPPRHKGDITYFDPAFGAGIPGAIVR
jgi:hypothetical protein